MENRKILIACTGSVATIKIGEIIQKLLNDTSYKFEVICCQITGLHIGLGKWADLMLIAPLDANTLAKMATGVCDNLLLCTTRAWNFDKPLFFCPAMNTRMWEHPITEQQIATLKQWGHIEIKCIAKKLMCGDTGLGAMETPTNIIRTIVEHLNNE